MDPITLASLTRSYARRMEWEAKVHADALARVLAPMMGAKVRGSRDRAKSSNRRGERVSADALRGMMGSV